MSDQTPEARLAAALWDALEGIGHIDVDASERGDGYGERAMLGLVRSALAADPTLAADLALGAAVRRLEATGREWSIEARPMTYHVWTGVFGDPTTIAPTLIEAIEEALPDEPA